MRVQSTDKRKNKTDELGPAAVVGTSTLKPREGTARVMPPAKPPERPPGPPLAFETEAAAANVVVTTTNLEPSQDNPEWRVNQPITSYPLNGLLCSICSKPQYTTPSGATCADGNHGGVSGVAPGVPVMEIGNDLLDSGALVPVDFWCPDCGAGLFQWASGDRVCKRHLGETSPIVGIPLEDAFEDLIEGSIPDGIPDVRIGTVEEQCARIAERMDVEVSMIEPLYQSWLTAQVGRHEPPKKKPYAAPGIMGAKELTAAQVMDSFSYKRPETTTREPFAMTFTGMQLRLELPGWYVEKHGLVESIRAVRDALYGSPGGRFCKKPE